MGSNLEQTNSFESSQIIALQQRLADETAARIVAEVKIERLISQIEALRRSISWRITKPLRILRRKMSND